MTQSYEGVCAVCGLRVIKRWRSKTEYVWRHTPDIPWVCPQCGRRWVGRSLGVYLDPDWARCPDCGASADVEHEPEVLQQEALL